MKTAKQTVPVIIAASKEGERYFKKLNDRRQQRDSEVTTAVTAIIDAVRREGDKAVLRFTEQFDGVKLRQSSIKVTAGEIDAAAKKIDRKLKVAITEAEKRIRAYHSAQVRQGFTITTAEGVLSQLIRPLQRVGMYIPGGRTVYPSTVLMDAVPAVVAGVPEIVAITPPRGELDPGIAFALKLLKIKEVYRIGGAQGIAALACGTATIPAVDKIVGPGNAYVQTAKRLLFGTVDIDAIAGPSEVAILADASVDPAWVALDLLSQAEHGTGDEFAVCITEDTVVAERIAAAVAQCIQDSPVRDRFTKLPSFSIAVLVASSRRESIDLVNKIAPEHLQIMTSAPRRDLESVKNAAAVFLGRHTPVALGDYFVGTNHVLPTGGAARFASPLGVDSFTKRMSVAEVTPEGLDAAAPFVSVFARSEAFVHHAMSVELR